MSAVRRVGAIGVEMGSVDAVMASVGGAAIENGSHDPLAIFGVTDCLLFSLRCLFAGLIPRSAPTREYTRRRFRMRPFF